MKPIHDDVRDATVFLQQHYINEYVIHVYRNDAIGNKVSENLVHHSLKGGRAVCHTEVHYQQLEQALIGAEHCLPLVVFTNANVVVAPANVELHEDLGTFESMDEVVNEWEGVLVFACDDIEGLVVLDESQSAIFFLDKEDWCTNR